MMRILSIAGLRGVVGNGLDPAYLAHFAATLGRLFAPGPVVVSRDGRASGEMIQHAVFSGLIASGCEVYDLGIASTPTCGVMVAQLHATGGLQITASHNPIEWNGLKPFTPSGSVFDAAWGERLLQALEGPTSCQPHDKLGRVRPFQDAASIHLAKVLALVDAARIRGRKFRVVLDCNHGSGSVFGPRLLQELGCDVIALGATPDGQFEHPAEPLKQNLQGLMDAVIRERADAGFAQDPDADRLAIVDNTGRYIGEELTLALCADHLLPKRKGAIVVNGSTSRVTADLAAKYGCEFRRSAVGEANVVSLMRQIGATLGGEGNGGVIEPKVGYVRDSFVSMAYVLDALAQTPSRTLAEWVDSLPSYTIIKDKIECDRERVVAACSALVAAFPGAQLTDGDGVRLDWPDRWVQVRASNTEPIIRIMSEAPNEAQATELARQARAAIARVL